MNKYAIIFCLLYHKNVSSKNHYLMLYEALDTLYSKLGSNIDIVVFYDINDNKDKKKNIFDFKAKFIEQKYRTIDLNDKLFYKWNCAERAFGSFDYEKILLVDVDLIFYKDPIFLFEKYEEETKIYCHLETPTDNTRKFLGDRLGINGGEILISKKTYKNQLININKEMLLEKKILEKKIKEQIKEPDASRIVDYLLDQYALTNVINKNKIEIEIFKTEDICYGAECYDINNQNEVIPKTKILHYLSNSSYLFCK